MKRILIIIIPVLFVFFGAEVSAQSNVILNSVSPASGTIGTSITLTGSNMTGCAPTGNPACNVQIFDYTGSRNTVSGTEVNNSTVTAQIAGDLCPGPGTIRVGRVDDTSNALSFTILQSSATPARCFPATPAPTPTPSSTPVPATPTPTPIPVTPTPVPTITSTPGPQASCSGSNPVNICNVQVVSRTNTDITVIWQTDVPSSTLVEFGCTTGYGYSASGLLNQTVHSVILTGLTPNTSFNFRAVSTVGGYTARSSNYTASTTGTGTSGCSTAPPTQSPAPVPPGGDVILQWSIFNPLKGGSSNDTVFTLIFLIINWILNVAGSLIVILIIYGGIRFLLSRGNPGEVQKAKSIIYWALVGFFIVLIGKGFILLVDSVLRGDIPVF